ncbi:MAG: hypothetical protein AAFV29_16375 [Myxococcota bacterium]
MHRLAWGQRSCLAEDLEAGQVYQIEGIKIFSMERHVYLWRRRVDGRRVGAGADMWTTVRTANFGWFDVDDKNAA